MSSATTSRENDQDERTIRSLCDRTGAPHADVQALFASESLRLGLGATVRSYVRLLAAANVYAALRRRARASARANQAA
jgi:hypothetical protein